MKRKRKNGEWREQINFTDGIFNDYLDIDVFNVKKRKKKNVKRSNIQHNTRSQ